ncbi:MAG: MYG1 family protein [Patescibacteria group bacterium]
MSFFTKKKILATHNGTFHADDIFATATLSILLDDNVKIIRTRDEKIIAQADYVYDVGSEYDPSRNRFDHHQEGGAGKRENGIPYAAFGLVWKAYGEKVSGSAEIATKIDESLVQAIDAHDNGVDLYTLKGEMVAPYLIENMFDAFHPTWTEEEEYDKPFMEVVEIAKRFLRRAIIRARDSVRAKAFIQKAYDEASDKRIIVLEGNYPWQGTLMDYPEPLYVVCTKASMWRVICVRKEKKSFENRKSLPQEWAGKRDEEMARISGVPDATFCHNGRFLAVARSKEGALALAQKALLA